MQPGLVIALSAPMSSLFSPDCRLRCAPAPHLALDDAYGFPVCDSGASCIDLNSEPHLSACSLVQARSAGATQPQPPERLDLTVSANEVMFCILILDIRGGGVLGCLPRDPLDGRS